jgi:phosphoglycolate phosphatase
MINSKKHIIFDWNGTLINDAQIFVNILNVLLDKRKLNKIDLVMYRDLFCFPRDAFTQLKKEFVGEYDKRKYCASLFPNTINMLQRLSDNNFNLSILSASYQKTLDDLTKHYSIDRFFQHIIGVNNYIANGKAQKGIKLINTLALKKQDLVLIGDTNLDYSVSKVLGIDCILISHGHQSTKQLEACNNTIIQSFDVLFE